MLIRVLAVALGLSPFVLCEAVLTVLDRARPGLHDDPFLGFSAVAPLFVKDATGARYEIPPAHDKFFCPESFDAVKPPGEFRIFCLGASTVQGEPFRKETSYTTWLEISLNAADPSRRWRVINCGGISYASYRLVPILQELLAYGPDLFIVDIGHNEFLEDRTYRHIKEAPRLVMWPLERVARLRTFSLFRSAVQAVAGRSPSRDRPVLGPVVEAKLDYRGGLATYHRDEKWRRDVVAHFAYNMRRMVRIAGEAEVPIFLINPIYNLDTPPFKSEHRDGLSAAELGEFESLWESARERYRSDMPGAIDRLRRAVAIDDRHAGIHYALAKCYQQVGRRNEAHAEFMRAKEEDVCPLRILEPMSRAVLDIGRETGTPVIDQVALFSARSREGLPGNDWLVDHVHPSIEGHKLVAADLLAEMVRQGFVRPVDGWESVRDRRYGEHFASLGDYYFLRGQKHATNLRLWAEGRGDRVRPSDPPPEATQLPEEGPLRQEDPTSSGLGNDRGTGGGDL